MLNYLKKFTLEILPSVAATVIGAYIVNHYISRPANNAPVAATLSPAQVSKPAEATNLPQHGVKAKGISERAMMEKSASEKPADVKPTEKSAEAKPSEAKPPESRPSESKPSSETASVPAETRHHFWSREKPVAKITTAPAPVASPAAPVDTAAAPAPAEDHRDANDLARAAIERLRGTDNQSRTQEAARTVETPRLQDAPRSVTAPGNASIRPLPPPITVSVPAAEAPANAAPYTASIRNDDPNRPTPPAEIPPAPPVDLRADASKLATHTTNVAQDVLSAAKSMFRAVLPNNDGQQQSSSSASQFTD